MTCCVMWTTRTGLLGASEESRAIVMARQSPSFVANAREVAAPCRNLRQLLSDVKTHAGVLEALFERMGRFSGNAAVLVRNVAALFRDVGRSTFDIDALTGNVGVLLDEHKTLSIS